MTPIITLGLLYFLGKKRSVPAPGQYGAPVAPGGTAVISMKTGSRYTVTLLFRGFGPGVPTPTPEVLAASANIVPSPASAFTVEPAATHIAQNLDGSWAAQITGTYNGGTVQLENQAWKLLQMAMA